MSEKTEPETVDLSTALEKMNADGNPPAGFHMMLLSPEFRQDEGCPTLQLLKKIGLEYNFADAVRRQVFQLPQDRVIWNTLIISSQGKWKEWLPMAHYRKNHKQGFHS